MKCEHGNDIPRMVCSCDPTIRIKDEFAKLYLSQLRLPAIYQEAVATGDDAHMVLMFREAYRMAEIWMEARKEFSGEKPRIPEPEEPDPIPHPTLKEAMARTAVAPGEVRPHRTAAQEQEIERQIMAARQKIRLNELTQQQAAGACGVAGLSIPGSPLGIFSYTGPGLGVGED